MDSSKKRRKLMIAIAAGFITALSIYSAISGLNKQITQQNNLINDLKKNMSNTAKAIPDGINSMTQNRNAVVSKQDIPAGAIITEEMVVLKEIAYDKTDAIKDLSGAIGKRTKVAIKANQIFQIDYIANEDNITFNIPTGYRAITIPIDYIQGLASYIKVGSNVDIISTSKSKDSQPSVIAENVKIIAFETITQGVPNAAQPSALEAKAITFKIPASSSSQLVDAMMSGKLQLVLRGYNDQSSHSQTKTVSKKKTSSSSQYMGTTLPTLPSNLNNIGDLFNKGGLPDASIPAPKKQQTIEFIQANSKSEVNFDD